MHVPSFLIFALVILLVLGALQIILLKYLNRNWWRNRRVRRLSYYLPAVGLVGILGWFLAGFFGLVWLKNGSVLVVGVTLVFELGLIVTLPVSSLIRGTGDLIADQLDRRKASRTNTGVDPGRRRAIGAIAAALPLTTLGLSAGGFGRALVGPTVYARQLLMPGLPSEMEGLKILHLSDLHLGPWLNLTGLEDSLIEAEKDTPDLVLVTGDIADDLVLLPEALGMISQLKAPLGTFASLGNHEHYRGITEVRACFDRSSIPLLVNQSEMAPGAESGVRVAAIDDPLRMWGDHTDFYNQALEQALRDQSQGDFVILMSHRPSVFDRSAGNGVPLTLSGHTHGGQLGFMGRSVFESTDSEFYLWGHYTRGNSHLYTSSGMGHWFPFRLGCPPEAPVLILTRG